MIIGVKFPRIKDTESCVYSFRCDFKVNIGDYVICETRYGFSLGRVHRYDYNPLNFNEYSLKRVIAAVDIDELEKTTKRMQLQEQLAEIIKQFRTAEIHLSDLKHAHRELVKQLEELV